MKVSLVATAKDAGPAISEFLASVRGQTRQPDEVVVVDGGSTDGTLEVLRNAEGVVAISQPGANISRGRNLAVRTATAEVLAVSDADCVLAPDWLEALLGPIERGADVSAGFYRPIATSLLEHCAAAVSVPERDELREGWMPSARSIAFRRETFEQAGGYPEWLDVGEDMFLNHRMVAAGARIALAPEAVAFWRVRPTLSATWRQYARYAEGDAIAGMYPHRHLLRFGVYGLLFGALASRRPWLLAATAAGSIAYARTPIRRVLRRTPSGFTERWQAIAAVPPMMAFVDAAKMWGYLRGLSKRGRYSAGIRTG